MTEGGDIDKLGRGTVWSGQIEPCLHQNHVFALRCNEILLPEYLAAWLAAPLARDYFYLTAKRTTNLAATNSTTVRELPITLPPIETQKYVLMQLDNESRPLNEAITRASREIDLLQEFRSRLIADLVTGQVDIRDVAALLPKTDSAMWSGDLDATSDAEPDIDELLEASEV